jgi:hypothetical protein
MTPGEVIPSSRLALVSKEQAKMVSTVMFRWMASGFDYSKLSIFEYQGFDPEIVWRHIYIKAGDNKISAPDAIFHEMGMLLGLQLMKGNLSRNNFGSMSREGQREANRLIYKWGITLDLHEDKKNSVHLPRLASAFPAASVVISMTVVNDYGGPLKVSGVPNYIRNQVFPSCVPKDFGCASFVNNLVTLCTTDQALAVAGYSTAKYDSQDAMDFFEYQASFTKNVFGSKSLTDDERAAVFAEIVKKEDITAMLAVAAVNSALVPIVPTLEEWNAAYDAIMPTASVLNEARKKDHKKMMDAIQANIDDIKAFTKKVKAGKATAEDADRPKKLSFFQEILWVEEEEKEVVEDEEEEEEEIKPEGAKEGEAEASPSQASQQASGSKKGKKGKGRAQ